MKKLWMVMAILMVAGAAQAAPFIVCDTQEGVIGYTLTGLTEQTVAAQTDGSLKYDLANVPAGSYSVQVAACNVWGCGEAAPYPFVKSLPARPAGVRLVAK